MPITTAFSTEIPRISILDEKANFDEKLGKGLIPNADLVKLYTNQVTGKPKTTLSLFASYPFYPNYTSTNRVLRASEYMPRAM